MPERTLDSCSGPWSGFWLQHGHRGMMRLTLTFASGAVVGDGRDTSGDFTMTGLYTAEGEVSLRKEYSVVSVLLRRAAPCLLYQGRWDGSLIHGVWQQSDDSWNTGEFELWPESDEDLAERSLTALATSEPAVPAPAFRRGRPRSSPSPRA